MKIFTRYILKNFIFSIGASWFLMTALFVFQQILTDFHDHRFPFLKICYFNILNIPFIVIQMCGPAIFMATLMTFSYWSRSSELLAFFSLGLGMKKISSYLLSFVLFICFFIFFIQNYILPSVFKIKTNYYYKNMENKDSFHLYKENIWYRFKNKIYHFGSLDVKKKKISQLYVFIFNNEFDLQEMIHAKEAVFDLKKNLWVFYSGSDFIFSPQNFYPTQINFLTKELPLQENPTDFINTEPNEEGLNFKNLWLSIIHMKERGLDTKYYEVKYHNRWSMTFFPFFMCFLALSFFSPHRRSGGHSQNYGICFLLTVIYWLLHSTSLAMGMTGFFIPWVSAWLSSFVFTFLAFVLFIKKIY